MNHLTEEADASNYMTPTSSVEQMPARNMAYLERMMGLCRAHGAIPVLISTPSTINWNTARHNAVETWSRQAGVDYIDYNLASEGVEIDWNTDSRDNGDHLNHRGAVKLSKVVGRRLAEDYRLPDHRGDPAYEMWEVDYQRASSEFPRG